MRTCTFVLTMLAISIATPALAQEKSPLPSSGSFKIHSGWKSIGESVQLGENHNYGSGNFWGVTYNDAGRGASSHGGRRVSLHYRYDQWRRHCPGHVLLERFRQ